MFKNFSLELSNLHSNFSFGGGGDGGGGDGGGWSTDTKTGDKRDVSVVESYVVDAGSVAIGAAAGIAAGKASGNAVVGATVGGTVGKAVNDIGNGLLGTSAGWDDITIAP